MVPYREMTAKQKKSRMKFREIQKTVFFQQKYKNIFLNFSFQVKIWFQNRRSKYKKLMKQGGVSVKTENGEGSPPNSDTEGMNGYVTTTL